MHSIAPATLNVDDDRYPLAVSAMVRLAHIGEYLMTAELMPKTRNYLGIYLQFTGKR